MSDASVVALAEAAGILIDWEDAGGVARTVSIESLRAVLSGLGLACDSAGQCAESMAWLGERSGESCRVIDAGTRLTGLTGRAILHLEDGTVRPIDGDSVIDPIGYHRIEQAGELLPLIVAPAHGTSLSPGERRWGMAVQLYSLRGDGAFGDFADLADFAGEAARAGADAVMLSPVHTLFTTDPSRYSPYSPSTRDYLNPWYASVESPSPSGEGLGWGLPPRAASGGGSPPLTPPLKGRGFDADLINWSSAVHAKLAALRAAFATQRNDPAFAAYLASADEKLRRHALFEALHAHFFALDRARGWQDWPAAYHDPAGPAVAAFAAEQAEEIAFHLFLQWRAEQGLAEAARAASAMRIGLVTDIAVGLDAGGSHAWARGDELMMGIGIGAPPDAFQAAGQNWGITSFSPHALRATAYRPFIDLLRSTMRDAGGIRIDHALGLRRLWVVPNGASPLDGAYLRQPEDDLLRLIALESARAGAIVIGEDLGVVPPGLRDRLAARGLLGMRVLPFERERDGTFRAPEAWDEAAVAMTSTHDLPPVAGWWQGVDIGWRETLGAGGDRDAERQDRAAYCADFWAGATAAGIAAGPAPQADDPTPAVDAAIAYTARTAAALAVVPVEDIVGLTEAPNLPGTIDEHPNWRRRLPEPAAALFARPDVAARIDRLATERPA